jgi:soluble lytic murein transglycosylase-like protein
MNILGPNTTSNLLDQASAGAEQTRLRQLQQESATEENRAGLEKSAKEFEAVFMNTLMKAMRKTVPDNKLFNSGGATKFYRQMHDAEMAKALATGNSGMGIADMIVRQFEQNVATKEAAGDLGFANPALPADPKPAPRNEIFGPPAPEAINRYRSLSPVGQKVAAMARMRGMAEAQGAAVADTLQRFEFEIGSAGVKSGLDPALILAVVMEESGGDPEARSHKGATGLMQLMPGTAAEMGVSDATSPSQNLHGGADYLAQMLRRYEGQLDVALAAYNAGPGNVDKAGGKIPAFKETERYVDRVLERYRGLGGGTNLANGWQD